MGREGEGRVEEEERVVGGRSEVRSGRNGDREMMVDLVEYIVERRRKW